MGPVANPIHDQLRELRLQGAFREARKLIRAQSAFASSPQLKSLLYEHEDFWWEPIVGRRISLRRRNVDDAAFVRACWTDAAFMRKFNRLARALPADDIALRGILAREYAGILSECQALHWSIYEAKKPIGFVSATEFSPVHRRCEFLIGILARPPSAAPAEAAHLAIDFLRTRARMERLTGYFYAENTHAARVARKFGFEQEGVLKGYMREADGTRSDLIVAGMALGGHEDATTRRRKRVMDRVMQWSP